MKILTCFSIFICISITNIVLSGNFESYETPFKLLSTPNVDSDPDDNITEVSEVYAAEFNCNVEELASLGKAENVDELKPSDIGIAAAIGDSMTAALFAKVSGVLGLWPAFINKHVLEYRGISWSIGGDADVTTLPNFIKKYNPGLKGHSVKTGKEGSANAAYNFAVSGAVASDLLEQATNLVNRINADKMDGEWKVITLFIGGNDLCAMCKDENTFSVDNFYNNVEKAINKLAELKKVYINLVQTVEISKVYTLTTDCGCRILQEIMKLSKKCSCVAEKVTKDYHIQYKAKIVELESFFRDSNSRDDFTVVVQPFFGITTIPKKDPLSYFAPDCFHLSQKGHLNAAVSLWNNMLEPVGQKTDEFLVNQPIKCPTLGHPYFYTHKNSKVSSIQEVQEEGNMDQGLSSGKIAGTVIGTLLAVAIIVGAAVGGGWLFYKLRKPKPFSKYESLSKPSRV